MTIGSPFTKEIPPSPAFSRAGNGGVEGALFLMLCARLRSVVPGVADTSLVKLSYPVWKLPPIGADEKTQVNAVLRAAYA